MEKIPYANMVESIMYSMVCTRPDMAYALSRINRYMANPGKVHFQALKWLMKYVKDYLNVVLIFRQARVTE